MNSASGNYFGLLAPGTLERTVLAWGANRPGRPLVVFAVRGLRAEAVLAGGDVTPFALSGSGGVLESGATVRRGPGLRRRRPADRRAGARPGLVDVPRERPL